MKLYLYQTPAGLTYADKQIRIGKFVKEVEAESTEEPIENENVIFANIGIFKVKMKIK